MPDHRREGEDFGQDEGLNACVWCEGMFVPSDMEGEHCRQCAAELFGDD
jgi:hypothetical protein